MVTNNLLAVWRQVQEIPNVRVCHAAMFPLADIYFFPAPTLQSDYFSACLRLPTRYAIPSTAKIFRCCRDSRVDLSFLSPFGRSSTLVEVEVVVVVGKFLHRDVVL